MISNRPDMSVMPVAVEAVTPEKYLTWIDSMA
jgi:hypothetical protein